MKIYPAVERQPTELPIHELMTDQGTFGFLAEVQKQGYFDIDYKGNSIVLVAGKFIGQIPLTDNIAINVEPKTPISNLERILDIVNQPIRCLDFYRRRYKTSYEKSKPIFFALIESLAISLRELLQEGIYKEFKQKSEIGSSPRGRINIRDSIRLRMTRANPAALSYSYFDLTSDTPLNRLIKYAIWYAGGLIAEYSQKSENETKLARELADYFYLFEAVKLDPTFQTIRRAFDDLESRELPSIRQYYLDIIDLCARIVTNESASLFSRNTGFSAHSYLVNMEDVFERYIRSLLEKSESLRINNIRVLDGNKEGRKYLFNDTKIHVAKPDVILQREKVPLTIGDVKYKPKITEQDRYQIISHAMSYGVQRAFTISPNFDDGGAGPKTIGTIGQGQPVQLDAYYFNLAATDFKGEEKKFLGWIDSLVSASL